ncbi:MAG TPA: helix-turn-helix domain-containing protein [Oscillatoriaceae cyanobacterium M33_DOE_052]|uniref:Helix-turn-helix domain-containing protein n=1 Tax=Planktothricoides sp. SpSt-374 TaxID=2282167 RepID=A0A7C3ZIP4_9CYAN|nr:helix-turn-helix domain-containing protein [Oscillatoriaceae cyanobacterium M33_DOE_052]
MSGVVKINIVESPETLKTLLAKQKTATAKERVQALYLLKTAQVETVQHLAVVLGRSRITVQRWLRLYRQGGIEQMLKIYQPSGRHRTIPDWAMERLKEELENPERFSTYKEVKVWLEVELNIQVSYDVVYYLLHDLMKIKTLMRASKKSPKTTKKKNRI